MSRSDLQVNFRMPAPLKEGLEALAKANRRSLTAEIVARLEETCEIDKALEHVAPGAPVSGTAGLLLDLDAQISDLQEELKSLAYSAAYTEITGTLSNLETLPLLSAALAIQSAFPEAMTKHQKERLLQAVATMIGSESRDPSDLLQALSSRLIDRALAQDLGL